MPFLENKQAVGQALEIIQGYTGTAQSRQLFADLQLCKQMLRLIADEELTLAH